MRQPETRRFNVTVVRPVLYETVDITGKTGSEVETEINQIEERLVDGCILNLTLTGYNDNGQYNLYELVMDMLRNSGINLYADKPNTPDSSLKTINLDFSSASGSMVETISDIFILIQLLRWFTLVQIV